MKFGYARVSTKDQSLDLQIDSLKKEGCDEVFFEKISGRSENKPRLEELLSKLTREGLKASRARGKNGGQPKGSNNKNKAGAAAHRYQQGVPIKDIVKDLQISRSTLYLYDYLGREGVKE